MKARLEAQNWAIALELYKGHPIPALLLAYQLMAIKQSLQRGRKGIPDAIAGLNLAIDRLYRHTDFDRMGRKFITEQLKANLSRTRGIAGELVGATTCGLAELRTVKTLAASKSKITKNVILFEDILLLFVRPSPKVSLGQYGRLDKKS